MCFFKMCLVSWNQVDFVKEKVKKNTEQPLTGEKGETCATEQFFLC